MCVENAYNLVITKEQLTRNFFIKLVEARKQCGKSVVDISNDLGLAVTNLYRFENLGRVPSLSRVFAYISAINCTISAIASSKKCYEIATEQDLYNLIRYTIKMQHFVITEHIDDLEISIVSARNMLKNIGSARISTILKLLSLLAIDFEVKPSESDQRMRVRTHKPVRSTYAKPFSLVLTYEEMSKESLGSIIREAREKSGTLHAELQKHVNASVVAVAFCGNKTNYKLEYIFKFMSAFNATLYLLIDRDRVPVTDNDGLLSTFLELINRQSSIKQVALNAGIPYPALSAVFRRHSNLLVDKFIKLCKYFQIDIEISNQSQNY